MRPSSEGPRSVPPRRGAGDDRRLKAAGVAGPGLAAGDRAAEVGADRRVVAVRHEAAAGREDVLERTASDRDLEDAAVERALQVVMVPERQLRRGRRDRDRRRVEIAVGHDCRIVHERRVGGGVGRCRGRGPRLDAEGAGHGPASGQRRRDHAVEILRERGRQNSGREGVRRSAQVRRAVLQIESRRHRVAAVCARIDREDEVPADRDSVVRERPVALGSGGARHCSRSLEGRDEIARRGPSGVLEAQAHGHGFARIRNAVAGRAVLRGQRRRRSRDEGHAP